MHTTTPVKQKGKTTLTITINPNSVSRGHQSHRSGAGQHHDRRTGRLRTRSAQNRAAMEG